MPVPDLEIRGEGRGRSSMFSCFDHIVVFISLVPKASIIARKKEAAAEKLQETMDEVADRYFMK